MGGPAPNCNDNNVCTDDACDPASGCTHTNNTASCDDGNACTTNDTCAGGTCVGGPAPNCNDNNVCTDDSCNPATGCVHINNTAPCNDGNACTTNDTCAAGACVGGPAPNCDDGNVCTTDGCNPASGCTHVNNTNPCSDGNACTTNDTCAGGACVGGPAPNCDDGNVCTDDSCNPATGCVHTNNTNPCSDGNACTTNDTCSGGTCVGGPAPNCDDGNVCTTDACNPASGCTHINNTNPCNDGNACTTSDTCANGTCVGGPAPNCDDGNVCTTDTCNTQTGCVHTNNTNPCSDGNACTTNDACSGGTCVGGPAPNCDDGNVCTDDSCVPATGCVHTNNTGPCNDGNACTTNDTCAAGACVGGPAANCNDNNVCTDDSCNPVTGCVHTNNTNPCSDGNACTTNDTCSGGTCIGGPAPNCDDGNVCTDDSCNPATGCAHTNNTAPCSDGNACTTNDTCALGSCVGGSPPNCNDNNVCTDDSCNPATGCVHNNNTAPCNDGDACTSNDTCSGGICTGTPTAVKYTGGGQFIATNGNKWSFGFNFRTPSNGPTDGEFNGLDHTSGFHINGPVIGLVTPCGNNGDCPSCTNCITFKVRDKKTGCIYRVTVEDNTEPGANSDRIRIQRLPSDQDPNAPTSCTLMMDTGCHTLSNGNIQKHPTN
ncbi:MAG TPA: post-COAP-1 domain-containing protein [Thermoanaerobaculia bacterium]|nr:post-COAP-1 domain-containing protein [Thermoanaerobaculia bacterium]